MPWKQICAECSLKKAMTSVLQHGDYCDSPRVPTSVQETKRPGTTQLPNPGTVCGSPRKQCCFRDPTSPLLRAVVSGRDVQDSGPPSLVPGVQRGWLCSTAQGENMRVKMFNRMLISSLKQSESQRNAFRRVFLIFSCLLLGNLLPVTVNFLFPSLSSLHIEILYCYIFT